MDRHNLPPGIDDEDHERSVLQPLRDLLVNLRVEVVRRDNLDGQTRRAPTIVPSGYPGPREPFTSDECEIGRTDRIRIGGEHEARLVREHAPELVLPNI